jgi:hypothetical protein
MGTHASGVLARGTRAYPEVANLIGTSFEQNPFQCQECPRTQRA